MSRPTPLRMMNSTYSRRMPVRARCANDQCRFMKYDDVAATDTDSALLVSGATPCARSTLKSVMSRAALNAPTMPNLAISWMRTWNRSYTVRTSDTCPRVPGAARGTLARPPARTPRGAADVVDIRLSEEQETF